MTDHDAASPVPCQNSRTVRELLFCDWVSASTSSGLLKSSPDRPGQSSWSQTCAMGSLSQIAEPVPAQDRATCAAVIRCGAPERHPVDHEGPGRAPPRLSLVDEAGVRLSATIADHFGLSETLSTPPAVGNRHVTASIDS